jgi:hypothetical protein
MKTILCVFFVFSISCLGESPTQKRKKQKRQKIWGAGANSVLGGKAKKGEAGFLKQNQQSQRTVQFYSLSKKAAFFAKILHF